ncbi:hypothetical protein EYF80_043067 [Liparis tanakae]|uniref:Uncharacterized protein n=1 Tax=Liparis tanakae TaxID=230148 RepID=A0A4Z2G0V3_9TELE|nr:hypothetical protein EYF80_043067 [Liparis tanakae]
MMRRRSKTKRSPTVTRSKRRTLKTNLFTCSTSLRAESPPALPSAPISPTSPRMGVPASDSFSSSMLQGAPLTWRDAASSALCSATGASSEITAVLSLASAAWLRERGMKQSPWDTERTGVEVEGQDAQGLAQQPGAQAQHAHLHVPEAVVDHTQVDVHPGDMCTALRRVRGTLVRRGPWVMDGQLLLGTRPALQRQTETKKAQTSLHTETARSGVLPSRRVLYLKRKRLPLKNRLLLDTVRT